MRLARENELRDNAIQQQQMKDENRKEQEAKAHRYKLNRILGQQSQEQNRAKLAEKERMQTQQKEEGMRSDEVQR